MTINEIRALLEGAYAQTPTLPGFYVNYEEFRFHLNKLVEMQGNRIKIADVADSRSMSRSVTKGKDGMILLGKSFPQVIE